MLQAFLDQGVLDETGEEATTLDEMASGWAVVTAKAAPVSKS